ncbi:MAG: shikimate dehydrogenase [Actinobacteria bacterium]|nr:shikimate dehydrogenase [Actinomycetota bacterium]
MAGAEPVVRQAFVVGDPIEHSRSPDLHNAAFAAVGLAHTYGRIRANEAEIGAVITAARSERWLGLSVTMPNKQAVIEHLDRLTPQAERLGAVNCVFWDGDRLCGDNTDGAGLVWAIRDHLGVDVTSRIGVLGAGGAARAAILALAEAGATHITVVNRTRERALSAAALAGPIGSVGEPDDLSDCDIVINATPQGMADTGVMSLPPYIPRSGQLAYDLIYHPPLTPWMEAAESLGGHPANGLSMLIGQAAVQFTRWTGLAAPTAAMIAAVA